MSEPDVRTRAELTRLARLLSVDPSELERLAPAGAPALRELTEQISDALMAKQRRAFDSVCALAERLPSGVAATRSQKVLGPVLSARAAAALRPEKAAELAPRFPAAFLAAVATAIDPRHVADLLARIPPDLAASVALELEAADEIVPMGMLMTQLSAPALRAGADALGDRTILRAGLFVEDPARLDEVVAGFDDERMLRLADVAEADDLHDALEDLIGRLGEAQRTRARGLQAQRA